MVSVSSLGVSCVCQVPDFLIEVFLSKGEQSRANLDFKSYQSNISGRHLMVYGTLA